MNLAIDIGNSRIKAALFNGAALVKAGACKPSGWRKLLAGLGLTRGGGVDSTISAAVANYPAGMVALLKRHSRLTLLTAHTPLPFRNLYKSPETLGKDRLAGVAGAWHLFPGKNALIVNAGTCITCDFITAKGEYSGGSISPGLDMRFKALHNFTSRLPLVHTDTDFMELEGTTTRESILTGVQQGIVEEVKGKIAAYSRLYRNLTVILTGGGHVWLASRLNSKIILEPYLTLKGLNVILMFCLTGEYDRKQPK